MWVKINEPFRVKVEGNPHTAGDVVEIDESTAAYWISNGWVTETKKPKAEKPAETKAATAKNKSRSAQDK